MSDAKNVVIITVDALRLDRLGYAGSQKMLTPNLDYLASQGLAFSNIITQAVETPISHGSLFSGCYPRIRGIRTIVNRKHVPAGRKLLAQHLRENGYATGGFISAYALDRNRGFGAGFDHYGDKLREKDPFYPLHKGHALLVMEALKRLPFKPLKTMDLAKRRFANETIAEAEAWLATIREDRPFFLFLHLFDTHCEYYSPAGFRAFPVRSNKKTLREFETGKREFAAAPLEMIERQYDMSVAWVDELVGGLVERLQARGESGRDTLVLLTADHGEGLGDHNYMLHGCELYDEEIRVPAIIASLSGDAPVGLIDELARTIDLTPTLLKLAGAEAMDCDGRDVLPLLSGDEPDERLAFTETRHTYLKSRWLRALRSRRFKYIYDASGRRELYDLVSDPTESTNVLHENADVAQELLRWQDREVGA